MCTVVNNKTKCTADDCNKPPLAINNSHVNETVSKFNIEFNIGLDCFVLFVSYIAIDKIFELRHNRKNATSSLCSLYGS